MATFKAGQQLNKYFPFISGVQGCVVVEKRTLVDGDYALDSRGNVFKRVGTTTLSQAERNRKYWVVEIVPGGIVGILQVNNLMNFTNVLPSGFLKSWKARGMLETLRDEPSIKASDESLIAYVKDCLEMEGFTELSCKKVAEYLKNN